MPCKICRKYKLLHKILCSRKESHSTLYIHVSLFFRIINYLTVHPAKEYLSPTPMSYLIQDSKNPFPHPPMVRTLAQWSRPWFLASVLHTPRWRTWSRLEAGTKASKATRTRAIWTPPCSPCLPSHQCLTASCTDLGQPQTSPDMMRCKLVSKRKLSILWEKVCLFEQIGWWNWERSWIVWVTWKDWRTRRKIQKSFCHRYWPRSWKLNHSWSYPVARQLITTN